MNKIEQLKFIIQRVDHYYNGVNLKGTFFLGINTFLLGICLSAIHSVAEKNSEGMLQLHIVLTLITLASLISIFAVLMAILPFLQNGHSGEYKSRIFFGSIAKYKNAEGFIDDIDNADDSGFIDDLARQTYTLSKGLKSKSIKIRTAGIALAISVLLTVVFFTLILTRI